MFESPSDLYYVGAASRRMAVWCSKPVRWISEYRVYVLRDRILSIDHYDGDAAIKLDRNVLETALCDLRAAGAAPVAYGIDFGVLGSGQTALVEMNDGYALGAYSIGAEDYADLLMARWRELLDSAKPPKPAAEGAERT
jgi:hypothetical protein